MYLNVIVNNYTSLDHICWLQCGDHVYVWQECILYLSLDKWTHGEIAQVVYTGTVKFVRDSFGTFLEYLNIFQG